MFIGYLSVCGRIQLGEADFGFKIARNGSSAVLGVSLFFVKWSA